MARFIQFDSYPVRTVITDIEVRLPTGQTCYGAATRQQDKYNSNNPPNHYLDHYFSEVALYGDHAPEQGTPMYAFAKSLVEAEARFESEVQAAEKERARLIEQAGKAYDVAWNEAHLKEKAARAKADADAGL